MANFREISGLSVSSLNGFLLPVTDVSSFKWISIHTGVSAFSGTISFFGGNDPNNVTVPVELFEVKNLSTATNAISNNTNDIWQGPLSYRYFAAQCTTYNSGAQTAIVELYENVSWYFQNAITFLFGANTGVLPLPSGAVQQNANGTATAGTATATLTGVGGKNTYLTGIEITVIDTATAGSAELSITGVIGGPLAYEINVQGTVGVEAPIIIPFTMPLQSSAVNTNIVVSLPSLGASTGKVSVVAHGYTL